jgi:acetyl esterase/lipase
LSHPGGPDILEPDRENGGDEERWDGWMVGPWQDQVWTRWALAGLALVVVGIGAAAVFLLRDRPRKPDAVYDVANNVVYGEASGNSLLVDIYRTRDPGQAARPGVLLIHGGGWVEGNKSDNRSLALSLAREGYVVFAVGYRLAKDDASRYPAQVDDVRRAVLWVRAHALELGVDPGRLGAFGHSAGGHLSAILGTTEVRAQGGVSSRVNCVVDCCGPSDFTDESSPPIGPSTAWIVPNFFGKTRLEAPEAYKDASPLAHVDARAAPTLIIHGTADDVVPIAQSRKLRDALQGAGVEVKMVELRGEEHVFQSRASNRRMLLETIDFLNRHLKP